MATVTDVEVANASFPTVRQDLNDILEAIATNFSADAEPTTTYANQWWYETDTNKLYIRNEDNDAWIHVLTLDQTTDTIASVEGAGGDKIEEGNSSVEVIDTGTGYIQFNVDGAEVARIDSDGMKFGDNEKAIFGAGSDLQIYHDGSNSFINDTGTGNLIVRGVNVTVQDSTTKQYFSTNESTGVATLFHNSNAKLATTSSGVSVTGDMTLSSSGAVNSELRSDFAGLQIGTTSNHYLALRSNNTERMRIDTSGRLAVGTTVTTGQMVKFDNTTASDWLVNFNNANATNKILISAQSGTGACIHHQFNNSNGLVGKIETSGSSTTYATSSDYRLKENVTDLTGAITRVKSLSPKSFNFIADPDDTTVDGFLAHEAQEVVPEAVTGTKDAMRTEEYEVAPAVLDEDGNVVTEAVMGTREVPDYQGIDQSKLVPLLTGALQEAIAKIEALEARVTALES